MNAAPLVRVVDPGLALRILRALGEADGPGARALRRACERRLKGATA